MKNQIKSQCIHPPKKKTYPNPNNSNPSTRNGFDISETPVTKSCNDRRDKLCNAERNDKSRRRTFHEEETMRTGDENQSLRNNGDLKVYNHVQLGVVRVNGEIGIQADTESSLKKGGTDDDNNQRDARDID